MTFEAERVLFELIIDLVTSTAWAAAFAAWAPTE